MNFYKTLSALSIFSISLAANAIPLSTILKPFAPDQNCPNCAADWNEIRINQLKWKYIPADSATTTAKVDHAGKVDIEYSGARVGATNLKMHQSITLQNGSRQLSNKVDKKVKWTELSKTCNNTDTMWDIHWFKVQLENKLPLYAIEVGSLGASGGADYDYAFYTNYEEAYRVMLSTCDTN